MGKVNRRNFLRSSLAGAGAAVLVKPAFISAGTEKSDTKIIRKKLGNTGLEVPVLSMGVMRADNPNLVRAAIDNGIVLFDTAHGYQRGRNEEMLGEVLKDMPRDKFIIQTKVPPGDRNNETGAYGPDATKESFLERAEISLNRLQMDYVDIFLHHGARSREGVMHEPALEALQELKKKGKTRFIGFSTHANEPEVIRAAAETGIIDIVTVSYNFKQDHRAEISAAMAEAAESGMGFIGMKTMAGGYLDKEKTKPVNGLAALKWALKDPNMATCVPGFTSFDELKLDAEVLTAMELTPAELRDLELAGEEMGMFCQGCSQCLGQCKKNLPIPEIMRSYMYAYGYGETRKAQETLAEYHVDTDPCSGCTECTVICRKGFPVAEKIADVSRLVSIPGEFLT